MHFKTASVIALITSVIASPAPTTTTTDRSANPPASAIKGRTFEPITQSQARYLTNGKRLALNLPIKSPKTRRTWSASHASPPKPSSSAAPVTTGYIQVISSDTGEIIGYLSKQLNSFGQYGRTTTSNDSALKVKFKLDAAAVIPTNIYTFNGPDARYPCFGVINGFSSTSNDIGRNSYNYQYFGATEHTPGNSPPSNSGNSFTQTTGLSQSSESAIFWYDPDTTIIEPRYVNSDRSKPETYAAIKEGETLILTGDKHAFVAQFGSAVWVTLKYVKA